MNLQIIITAIGILILLYFLDGVILDAIKWLLKTTAKIGVIIAILGGIGWLLIASGYIKLPFWGF